MFCQHFVSKHCPTGMQRDDTASKQAIIARAEMLQRDDV